MGERKTGGNGPPFIRSFVAWLASPGMSQFLNRDTGRSQKLRQDLLALAHAREDRQKKKEKQSADTMAHIELIDLRLTEARNRQICADLRKGNFAAFHEAAATGDARTIDELARRAQKAGGKAFVVCMISSRDNEALRTAAANGHTAAVAKICEIAEQAGDRTTVISMMRSRDCEAFRMACCNGHTATAERLADIARNCGERHLLATMLRSRNYEAYHAACQNGHEDTARMVAALAAPTERVELFNRHALAPGGLCPRPGPEGAGAMPAHRPAPGP